MQTREPQPPAGSTGFNNIINYEYTLSVKKFQLRNLSYKLDKSLHTIPNYWLSELQL